MHAADSAVDGLKTKDSLWTHFGLIALARVNENSQELAPGCFLLTHHLKLRLESKNQS
jgi:hypothetical protein